MKIFLNNENGSLTIDLNYILFSPKCIKFTYKWVKIYIPKIYQSIQSSEILSKRLLSLMY